MTEQQQLQSKDSPGDRANQPAEGIARASATLSDRQANVNADWRSMNQSKGPAGTEFLSEVNMSNTLISADQNANLDGQLGKDSKHPLTANADAKDGKTDTNKWYQNHDTVYHTGSDGKPDKYENNGQTIYKSTDGNWYVNLNDSWTVPVKEVSMNDMGDVSYKAATVPFAAGGPVGTIIAALGAGTLGGETYNLGDNDKNPDKGFLDAVAAPLLPHIHSNKQPAAVFPEN